MTWKQMQEVVANCEDFCKVYGRIPYFYIAGGDPILHPDFWKLMVLLKSKKIPFTLMGNPFHLDDEICRMPFIFLRRAGKIFAGNCWRMAEFRCFAIPNTKK